MSAPLKSIEPGDLAAVMLKIGADARAAARILCLASPAQKNRALLAMARALRADVATILKANDEDAAEAGKSGASAAFIDRLRLDRKRALAIADGVEAIAARFDRLQWRAHGRHLPVTLPSYHFHCWATRNRVWGHALASLCVASSRRWRLRRVT